jgi:hypothetical protein
MISTPRTAARIAEIYLNSVYGAAQIGSELPLKVRISKQVWHVTGRNMGPGHIGGVAEIDLCQSTGQVLHVTHGK